ncbi:MAG: alpha/beta hydrolase [Pirellulales bacterium]
MTGSPALNSPAHNNSKRRNPGLVSWLVSFGILVCFLSGAAKCEELNVHGVKLHYLKGGGGEPILLVHGLHSSAKMNWELNGIYSQLCKTHRVLALDLPGHGRSDKPEDEAAYGSAVVADIEALLDHERIDNVHLVGYSIGSLAAMKFTAEHPKRVKSLTVCGMGWLKEGSRLQTFFERAGDRDGGRTPEAFMRGISDWALTEAELKSITVPTQVIVGSQDIVNRLYVQPLHSARPDWNVVSIQAAAISRHWLT